MTGKDCIIRAWSPGPFGLRPTSYSWCNNSVELVRVQEVTGYAAMKPALQKIKVVNQPVRPADSAGPFQRFIAAASTLPGLARGRGQAEPTG